MNLSESFFPDPLGDFEPEIDHDFDLEENCLSCGKQYGLHSTRDIVQCALNELRGETPKG